jgi:gliding motility-associated-like protein
MFLLNPKLALKCLFVSALFFLSASAEGQITADFTASVNAGCSPLSVQFINKTTGASNAATYTWNFGNGNTSTLFNAGATFFDEKKYTVTLTVKDGAQTVSKNIEITVYKKPTVDFTANATKGCLPFPVQFTSTSTPGDGTLASFFWDFGDGNIQSNSSPTISHTYNFAQKNTVKLVVSNSFGCQSETEKKDLIEVFPSLTTSFTADKNVLCSINDAVTFTNASSGPGTLSYAWDFGDGTTSNAVNPSHTYAGKGNYTVKLNVTTSDGCISNYTLPTTINAANFTADFNVPVALCENSNATFTALVSTGASNINWQFNDVNFTEYGTSVTHQFMNNGNVGVTMNATYGTCPVTVNKTVTVSSAPALTGFVIDPQSFCGAPVIVNLKDTTSAAVKWAWSINNNSTFSTAQQTQFNFNTNGTRNIRLTVTNAAGCSASITQPYTVELPNVTVSSPDPLLGCPGLSATFIANSTNATIVDWKWNTGDTTSTDSQPTFTFNTPRVYNVVLNYTTDKGCKGTAQTQVRIDQKPVIDFTSITNVCGNTPVEFTISSNVPYNYSSWDFGDNSNAYTGTQTGVFHQYNDEGVYTVQLTVQNGSCQTVLTKTNYITVVPPFADIFNYANTCVGTRGEVVFTDSSKKADTYVWDFGDGKPSVSYNAHQDTVKHIYTQSGSYQAFVTVTKGACTVRDSITLYVLLKQDPSLSAPKTSACVSDLLNVQIGNLETNPWAANVNAAYYATNQWQYGNAVPFNGSHSTVNNNWQTAFTSDLTGGNNGKQKIRLILQSYGFGCLDTTNYLDVEFRGPTAGFKILNNDTCFYKPFRFQDTSHQYENIPITKWEWNFGDGKTLTQNNSGIVVNNYADPGSYLSSLKITDAEGCTDAVNNKAVTVRGPKADFTWSPSFVTPGNNIQFSNQTNTYGAPTTYQWNFTFGSVLNSTSTNVVKTYPGVGFDTIKLVASNSKCADSVVRIIPVKVVHAAFSSTSQYVNNNSCPPMVAVFQNLSTNYSALKWDFGDGSFANNNPTPSHTYTKPGEYVVKLIAYGINNNLSDTAVQILIVKGPYAVIKADVLQGCSPTKVLLTAATKNTTSYVWDLADGTLVNTNDTFVHHTYTVAGIYKPALIMKDQTGCAATFTLPDNILVDSLKASFTPSPHQVCDSQTVYFNSTSYNFAKNALGKALTYKWDFGTGIAADTANTENPSFFYNKNGVYPVKLTVRSEVGCVSVLVDTIKVSSTVKGNIFPPANICTGSTAQFTGTTSVTSPTVKWFWDFKNGNTTQSPVPPAQTYNTAGTYNVWLIIENKGCYDTAVAQLIVSDKPQINLSAAKTTICLGESVQLSVQNGVAYSWNPSSFLNNTTIANPIATPLQTTKYIVTVTNQFACVNSDSIVINVSQPFSIKSNSDTVLCEGLKLPISTTGALSYKWINSVGLNSVTIPNPIATPAPGTNLYTVVGYGSDACFTDTASFVVTVKPFPTIDAGSSVTLPTGSTFTQPVQYSSNVAKWQWSPSEYLSCNNCPQPTISPKADMTYTIKVTSDFGCVASDTFSVKLFCSQSTLFIPNTFTPNGDGMNDVFYIRGKAIKTIKRFLIYNRLGEKIFERMNVKADDASQGWDGRHAGKQLSTEVFTYVAELVCDTGEEFKVNGTIMIVR